MPLSAMVKGFDDLQYIWSISVAFRVEILVGSVITGSRFIYFGESIIEFLKFSIRVKFQ